MFRYHHCLYFLTKKKKINKKEKRKIKKIKRRRKKDKKKREKEKERGDIHNQSINHWCLTYLSCILEGLYG